MDSLTLDEFDAVQRAKRNLDEFWRDGDVERLAFVLGTVLVILEGHGPE